MSQTKAQLIDNLVQPITGALGSASAPTFSFTSDPNTGLYSPGADQLALTTGGTGRLFIDSNGRVGVGVAALSQAFTVRAASGGTTARFENTNSGNFIDFQEVTGGTRMGYIGHVNATDMYVHNDKAGPLIFDTNNLERLRITSAGLVGVGTNSPADILHLSNAGDLYLRVANTSTGINAYLGQDSNGTYIGNTGAAAVRFIQGAAERMRLDTSGRLGIGTSSPTGLLTVAATSPVIDWTNSSNTAYKHSIESTGYSASAAGNTLAFKVASGSGTQATVMTLDGSGRVGIGTTSPFGNFTVYKSGSSYVDSIVLSNDAGSGANQGIAWGSSSNISARIFGLDDGAYGTHLIFANRTGGPSTTTTERARIDSYGRLLVGTSSASGNALIQVEGGIRQTLLGSKPDTAGLPTGGETRFYAFSLAASGTWETVLSPPLDGNTFYEISYRIGVSDLTTVWGLIQVAHTTGAPSLTAITGGTSYVRISSNTLQMQSAYGSYGAAVRMKVTRIS